MQQTLERTGFEALEIDAALTRSLAQRGITDPTPIQAEAIPHALNGSDVIGIAQTGTGKTLAFGLPMVIRLEGDQKGLVLAPTRELAHQIEETLHKLNVRTALVVGGDSMRRQVSRLRSNPSIVVATPGRLIDHLEQGTIRLDKVSIVVLDEADRMLDMGFAPAIRRILDQVPTERQTLLFSATMPNEIVELASRYLQDPIRVQVARSGEAAELVDQELIYMEFEEKQPMLAKQLEESSGPVLVFTRTRHGARKLAKAVRTIGHTAAELHSDRTLAQRREALSGFKSGDNRVLVATDIAARGIDVKDISLVVNYDLPENPEDYVHRIGRTGRAGARGRAVTFALLQQQKLVRDIEKILRTTMPVSEESTVMPRAMKPRGKGRNVSDRTPVRPEAVEAMEQAVRQPRAQASEPKREWQETSRSKPSGKRPFGNRSDDRNDRSQSARKWPDKAPGQRSEKRFDDSRSWNDDRSSRGDKPFRDNRGARSEERQNYRADRPQADRQYGDRPQSDRRPRHDRPSNDRPFNDWAPRDRGSDRPFRNDNGYSRNDRRNDDRRPQGHRSDARFERSADQRPRYDDRRPRQEESSDTPRPAKGRPSGTAPWGKTARDARPQPMKPRSNKRKKSGGATSAPSADKKSHRGWTGKPKKRKLR